MVGHVSPPEGRRRCFIDVPCISGQGNASGNGHRSRRQGRVAHIVQPNHQLRSIVVTATVIGAGRLAGGGEPDVIGDIEGIPRRVRRRGEIPTGGDTGKVADQHGEIGAGAGIAEVATIINGGIAGHGGSAVECGLGDTERPGGVVDGHALGARASAFVPIICLNVVGGGTGRADGIVLGAGGGGLSHRLGNPKTGQEKKEDP